MTMNRRTGASQLNRFRQIDILRAVAVLLVLGRHLTPCPEGFSHFLHHVTRIWNQGGWIGVDLFFVLSGFLVSGLLFREHEKFHELHIGHFLIRRGFKIYPPFWLLIGATVLVAGIASRRTAVACPRPRVALRSELRWTVGSYMVAGCGRAFLLPVGIRDVRVDEAPLYSALRADTRCVLHRSFAMYGVAHNV